MAPEQPHPDQRPAKAAPPLAESVEFQRLVREFRQATGLDMHAVAAGGGPETAAFAVPTYCQSLQAGHECPLLSEADYGVAAAPEIRDTCAGVGHVVVPVTGPDGAQVVTLVSDSVRFGPVDMAAIIERSFRLKVFPDDLAAEAEAVPMVPREQLMAAAQALFAALHEGAGAQPRRANALELLVKHVAAAPPARALEAILAAALEFTGAEFAYIALVDAQRNPVADASTLNTRGEWWRITGGMAQWVVQAEQAVEAADVAESAWCRHLAGSTPPNAAVCGMPLTNGAVYGAIVVGGAELGALDRWRESLRMFVEAGEAALVLCMRLIDGRGGNAMVDPSGAYSLSYLEELLEKEISRAGRHNHELSMIVFDLVNYPELVSRLGAQGAEAVLLQLVELIRANTRKVNSLARVSDAVFVLVVPEADESVADRIADELRVLVQTSTYGAAEAKRPVKLDLATRTLTNPGGVLNVLDNLSSVN